MKDERKSFSNEQKLIKELFKWKKFQVCLKKVKELMMFKA